MVEKRGKFAALADLHRAEPEVIKQDALAVEVRELPAISMDTVLEKSRGRPATGKRSNPDWKLYSHFLKRKTQRAAVAKLQAEDSDRDLSDVLQELLEQWINA